MKLKTVINFLNELEDIKLKELSISEYCKQYKRNRSQMANKIKQIIEIRDDFPVEAARIIELYSELVAINTNKSSLYDQIIKELTTKNSEENSLNGEIIENNEEDSFDGRSTVQYIRNKSNNQIASYKIIVKVRDKVDYTTVLSRSDAETIFGLYTYYGGNITARNVANEFPRYTLPEIKKIFRAFKLTKDSAWFPPHISEEYSPEEIAQYRMNIKERAAFKYADATQERDFKKTINKMASEINKLSNFKTQLGDVIRDCTVNSNITPKNFPKVVVKNKTIMIFLSDMHIGAKVNNQSLFENQYDMDVIYKRLDVIINHFAKFKPCQKITVVNLGDALDGMDNQTARRDHHIPQNMNNFEQINNYVKAIQYLFTNLIENGNAAEYAYISVPCGNHDGIAGYAAAQLAASTLQLHYPQIETLVGEKFYVRYDVGEFSYLLAHGKDEQFMRNGFKINLDTDTELKINQYIDYLGDLKSNINIVTGDLHNESMNRGKKFKYYKVGSFFGSSEYCMYGWGNTRAHVNYHVIADDILMNGTIEL